MPAAVTVDVDTPVGLARLHTHRVGGRSTTTLVLGHGAGGGVGARDLVALATRLPALGVTVVLVEQPWRTAGRKIAVAPAQLDLAWRAVLASDEFGDRLGDRSGCLVVGGRSAGARVACRTASAVGADGVLALAFPLHPPGRPGRSRADELLAVTVPLLVVQGGRDAFGPAAEFPPGICVAEVPHADHAFAVPKRGTATQAAALAEVCRAAVSYLGKNFDPGLLEQV